MEDAMDKKPLDRVAKDGPKAIVLRKQLNKIGKSDKGEGAGQQAVIEQRCNEHHYQRDCEDQDKEDTCWR
ncbi:hypothetical protein [Dysosmobacter welbionis]|uniref:hypothetical protein n=1 Tax=Dysosmobacter welbionis TaxID=2093857 RepID=UPI00210874DC